MNVASAVSFVWDTKPDFPSVAGVSHILGFMQSCHQLEICAKQRRLLQDQIQLGIKVKVQL